MKRNIFSILISTIFKLFGCLLVAIIISIIIEWIGLTFIWKDNLHHAKEMFEYEYSFVNDSFERFIFGESLAETMNKTLQSINDTFSSKVLSNKYVSNTSSKLNFSLNFASYFEAAGYIIFVVLMRAFVFLLSLTWFIICAIVAFTDGLVERSIRKFEGGVEHGMIHHLARSNFNFVIGTAFVLYLGMPIAIHPAVIIIPFGILFGLIIYVATWSFKKYL